MTKKEVLEFFRGQKCEMCPFKEECDNLYDHVRQYTTNPPDLCTTIFNRLSYEF